MSRFSKEELQERSRAVFRKILLEYTERMSHAKPETASRLNEIVSKFSE